MKEIDIIFSADNNAKVMVLPVIVERLPEVVQEFNNSTFESINGEFTIIGNKSLRSVTITSWFPINKNYSFIRPGADKNGWNYVAFFNKYATEKKPIRMVWLEDGREISNLAYTIESFTTSVSRIMHIDYTLVLKEYRFVKVKGI